MSRPLSPEARAALRAEIDRRARAATVDSMGGRVVDPSGSKNLAARAFTAAGGDPLLALDVAAAVWAHQGLSKSRRES